MMSSHSFVPRCLRLAAVLVLSAACLSLPSPLLANRPDIVWIVGGHAETVTDVAFSHDGSTLATSGYDGTAKLWRRPGLSLIRILTVSSTQYSRLAFSSGGILAAVTLLGDVHVWRVSDGALLHTLPRTLGDSEYCYGRALAFSPDGTILAIGCNERVVLWRLSDWTQSLVLNVRGYTHAISFSPDGASMAVGSGSTGAKRGYLEVYRVADGSQVRSFSWSAVVTSLAFSPDGKTIISARDDYTVELLSAETGRTIWRLQGLPGEAVAFSPEGQTVALLQSMFIRLLRSTDGSELSKFSFKSISARSLAFSPDGTSLAAVGYPYEDPGAVALMLSLPDGAPLATPAQHTAPINDLCFSPDAQTLVSCSWKVAMVHNAGDGIIRQILPTPPTLVDLDFSPDGQTLAAGSGYLNQYGESGALLSWGITDWQLSNHEGWLYGHLGVYAIAFSPDGGLLAVGSAIWGNSGRVAILRLPEWARVSLLPHAAPVSAVAFSPDARTLASASWSPGDIKLWRVSDGALVATLLSKASSVRAVVFSPDSRMLAAALDDGTVRLWRVADGVLLRTLPAHISGVRRVCFALDGHMLITGGTDGTIKLWRVADGALLCAYDEEAGPAVYSLAVSPDGRTFAYGRSDATVVVAKLPALFAAAARLSPDGTPVTLADAVVSAVFDGHFYAQEADRSAGIRVDHSAEGLIVGQRVKVEGTMGTNANGERFIAANSIAAAGSGEVEPLHATGKALGGGDFGSPPRGQQGIAGSFGLNNIGLLVSTTGRVSAPRVPAGWFYTDDGSGVSDGTGIPGIYVDAGGFVTPPPGSFATVTGISSCEWYEGRLVNVLRARIQEDILVHTGPGAPEAHVAGSEVPSDPRHAR